VTWLLGINTGIFLLMELFGLAHLPIVGYVIDYGALTPVQVIHHGWIWQLVTYSVLHAGFMHWFGNMLGLWMFGSAIESAWGTRRLVELFLVGVVGAAVTTVALSYAHILGDPNKPTLGASGGVFAILIAFGMLFGDNEIMMIPARTHRRSGERRARGTVLRHAQFVLPLEAEACGKEVRSLHVEARPPGPLRRAWELHSAG
jgi:membrane associated rhomboid family serine protease